MSVLKGSLATNGVLEKISAHTTMEVLVSGLTSGTVKLQALLPGEAEWKDVPSGSFDEDIWQTMSVLEPGVDIRAVGVGNNAGVYVRVYRPDY